MVASLIINRFTRISRANSLQELWCSLTNDQWFELSRIFYAVFGREPESPFSKPSDDGWSTMANLIAILGSSVVTINSHITGLNWDNACEVDGALEDLQRKASGHSQQHSEVMRYLAIFLRNYRERGDNGPFDSCLLEVRTVMDPLHLDDAQYEIFICYKIVRHASQAAWLHNKLTALGHTVWFDKEVLTKMHNRPEHFEKEQLISILTNAIQHSNCTVIFEAVMHAVLPLPGRTEEESLSDRTAISGPGESFLAWDWQVLEIAATERGITIHPNLVTAFRRKSGETLWSKSFQYENDKQLLEAIKMGLALFDSTPPS